MKVPLSWLAEFVTVDDLALDELVDRMSLNGLEVEEVLLPGQGTRGVRTKRVTHRRPHPDADTLQVVRVTDGAGETELVCGAWNFEVGDVVAHAEVGASIPGLTLSQREIRGVVSNGMLCSARELQLGQDHEGIIVLPGDTPVGVELTDVLPVGEPVIDVAVLSDRGDHHSILGIARELAALLDRELRVPPVPKPAEKAPIDITIEATAGCSHFATWAVEGVTIGPSPWRVRQRLEQCGIRAINRVVDVTNYVMLELGQPLHAFDLDSIQDGQLTIRWAEPGERLVTLDDQERALTAADLVIADGRGPVSLAGVMGGRETEVTDASSRVLLEAAVWDPLTIRRTSRRLNLVSEASLRFERRVDPAGAGRALARAVELLSTWGPATPAGSAEAGAPRDDHATVDFDPAWAASFLGLDDLDPQTQRASLERLGCRVEETAGGLRVTPPSWRGDLHRPADLAEEVARLYGYERIPARMPELTTRGGLHPDQRAIRDVREAARAAGFHEARTRPFVGERALEGAVQSDGRVVLENPLAKDASAMAPSLVEGLLGVIRHNVGQGRPGTAVFELARVFRPVGDPIERNLAAFGEGWRWTDEQGRPLPTQPLALSLAAHGAMVGVGWIDEDRTWTVFDLLAVLDDVVDRLARPAGSERILERRPTSRGGFHPGRSAELLLDGVEIGFVGQLHPDEVQERDLTEPVVVAELLLDPLLASAADAAPVEAPSLARHPAMVVDVALAADDDVSFATLREAVREGAGDLLDELWVFDEYRGDQVGEGRRSVAVRLRLQSPERQLTDEDAERVIRAVGEAAAVRGATLRR